MSFLDVSEVLSDPDIADGFVVKRRAQVMGQNGRAGVAVEDLRGVGVICAASPNDLKRLPDEQHTERHISIITRFRLRATAPDYQPDLVGWQGDFFIVRDVQPYTQYGAGFVQVLAGSIDFQDEPTATGAPQVFPPGAERPSLATIYGDGAPIDGPNGTGAGNSGPGRVYIDQAEVDMYINASQDAASPVWKLVPRAG